MTQLSAISATSALGQMPWHQRMLGKIISSESHGKFAIDTACNWTPKMLFTVRTPAEAVEVSFLEFVESGFFYYAPHMVGEKLFAPLIQKLTRHLPEAVFKEKLLTKSLAEIRQTHPQLLQHVLPLKAGIILASVGAVGVAGEYALSFVKNLITLKAFNTGRFTDVANLTHGQRDGLDPRRRAEMAAQNEAVKSKAFRRIKQATLVSLGLVGLSVGMARFGGKLPGGGKLLERLVEKFDFNFAHGKFGLSKPQMRALIGLGVIGYMDACRDDLEFKEVGSRLAIVAPYLAYGNEFLTKLLAKPISRFFPQLLQKSLDGSQPNYQLGLEALEKEALSRAKTLLGNQASPEALRAKSFELMKPLIQGKNALFLASFLLGSIGVGLGTTRISQHFTKLRHARRLAEENHRHALSRQPLSPGSGTHLRPIRWAPPARHTPAFSQQNSYAFPAIQPSGTLPGYQLHQAGLSRSESQPFHPLAVAERQRRLENPTSMNNNLIN